MTFLDSSLKPSVFNVQNVYITVLKSVPFPWDVGALQSLDLKRWLSYVVPCVCGAVVWSLLYRGLHTPRCTALHTWLSVFFGVFCPLGEPVSSNQSWVWSALECHVWRISFQVSLWLRPWGTHLNMGNNKIMCKAAHQAKWTLLCEFEYREQIIGFVLTIYRHLLCAVFCVLLCEKKSRKN